MPALQITVLTSLALAAFAGNSLLCRAALLHGSIDASSFTLLRLASGAFMLVLLMSRSAGSSRASGSWISAAALFVYAFAFSWAYLELAAGLGALLLFGSVQITMIGVGIARGERIKRRQWLGFSAAILGLLALLMPQEGHNAKPLLASFYMIAAGIAWGIYSLRGRGQSDAAATTTGNFMRSVPFALVGLLAAWRDWHIEPVGAALAIASGALASALGYIIWYQVLPFLKASKAATLQLTVPVLTAFAGVIFLDEAISLRMLLASAAILGGVAIFVLVKK